MRCSLPNIGADAPTGCHQARLLPRLRLLVVNGEDVAIGEDAGCRIAKIAVVTRRKADLVRGIPRYAAII